MRETLTNVLTARGIPAEHHARFSLADWNLKSFAEHDRGIDRDDYYMFADDECEYPTVTVAD